MPYAVYIPLSCLAAILVMVAYNMSEWRTFKYLLRGDRSDVAVLLITFFLTVIVDLTVAIEVEPHLGQLTGSFARRRFFSSSAAARSAFHRSTASFCADCFATTALYASKSVSAS